VLLNLATVTGFGVIDAVIGGQTLSAVNNGGLSVTGGIVIVCLITLVISFFGYKVLHQFERYAWLPALIAILVATGCGGKHLSKQVEVPAPAASTVISFGALVGGFVIPWAALSSDFATYIKPETPS
jgi:purine-cytosine permease-like protein